MQKKLYVAIAAFMLINCSSWAMKQVNTTNNLLVKKIVKDLEKETDLEKIHYEKIDNYIKDLGKKTSLEIMQYKTAVSYMKGLEKNASLKKARSNINE